MRAPRPAGFKMLLRALARLPLWMQGFDYDHGTGHGVGAYLAVHEGPAGLSRRSLEPLLPGMILSIEPGYYREGAFGIRCENLGAVTPPAGPHSQGYCVPSSRCSQGWMMAKFSISLPSSKTRISSLKRRPRASASARAWL